MIIVLLVQYDSLPVHVMGLEAKLLLILLLWGKLIHSSQTWKSQVSVIFEVTNMWPIS
jgi:hypothetical protein